MIIVVHMRPLIWLKKEEKKKICRGSWVMAPLVLQHVFEKPGRNERSVFYLMFFCYITYLTMCSRAQFRWYKRDENLPSLPYTIILREMILIQAQEFVHTSQMSSWKLIRWIKRQRSFCAIHQRDRLCACVLKSIRGCSPRQQIPTLPITITNLFFL